MTIADRRRKQITDRSVGRYEDLRDLMPDVTNPTPLARLNRTRQARDLRVYLKLEWLSPFGSIKDRTARYIVQGLVERAELTGRHLVEASSGNTAIALAALGALDGFDLTVTIPDGVPDEKKVILRMLGAEVWETPDDLCPVDHPKDGAIALARSLAASDPSYVLGNQYESADNVRAHYETTGPEIWRQTEGEIKWFVAGLGTTGTVSGVGRYLKEQDPSVRIIGVEPQPGHRLPGLKSFAEAKEPGIADWSVVDEIVEVHDEPAYEATRDLWRNEGLMVGPSTGAMVAALDQLDTQPDDVVVAISADSGLKYTSYFKELIDEEGIPQI